MLQSTWAVRVSTQCGGTLWLRALPWPKPPLGREWGWILQNHSGGAWDWRCFGLRWQQQSRCSQHGDDVHMAMASFTLSFQVHTILKPKAQIVEGMSQREHARSIFQSLCKLQLVGFAQPYLINHTTKPASTFYTHELRLPTGLQQAPQKHHLALLWRRRWL